MTTSSSTAKDPAMESLLQECPKADAKIEENMETREATNSPHRPGSGGSESKIQPTIAKHKDASNPPDLARHPAYNRAEPRSPNARLSQAREELISIELANVLKDTAEISSPFSKKDSPLSKVCKLLQEQQVALQKRELMATNREQWLSMRENQVRRREERLKEREFEADRSAVELAMLVSAASSAARKRKRSSSQMSSTIQTTMKDFWHHRSSAHDVQLQGLESNSGEATPSPLGGDEANCDPDSPRSAGSTTSAPFKQEQTPLLPKRLKKKKSLRPRRDVILRFLSTGTPQAHLPVDKSPGTASSVSEPTDNAPRGFWTRARQTTMATLTFSFLAHKKKQRNDDTGVTENLGAGEANAKEQVNEVVTASPEWW